MIKLKLNEPHGNWRLTVVQNECKTKLIYHVVECTFEWQERTVNLEYLCLFAGKTLPKQIKVKLNGLFSNH